jgi:2,4-dienoyl-CoA reductase-like NADH-dependent reductase (Old Yellow Enzyme family)
VLGLAAGCDATPRTAAAVVLVRALELSEVDVVLLRPAPGDAPQAGHVLQVADAVRNETGVAVIVDDGLRTLDAADTAIAAGRADLCVLRFDEPDAGETR